jgi:DNA mismatch repair protein MutS2
VSDSTQAAVLTKLELPAILDRLAGLCRFSVAAERAREIGPSGDVKQVRYLLDVTQEAVNLMTDHPDISIGGARDVRELAGRAEKGGRLQPADLLLVHDMVTAARHLRRSFLRLPEVDSRFPNLLEFVGHVADLPDLEADIGRSISPRGDVLDSASEELSRVRRAIRIAHNRLFERLNSMISGRFGSAVQDAIITSRDGRYVIPIKSEARGQVPGVVHDTSASGQTLFIEPLEIVELNNKWREEQIAEQREIDRAKRSKRLPPLIWRWRRRDWRSISGRRGRSSGPGRILIRTGTRRTASSSFARATHCSIPPPWCLRTSRSASVSGRC